MLNERKLTERELDKRAEAIQGLLSNKRTLVKKYGKDAEKVMYGIATKQAKSKVEGMNKDKIKEFESQKQDILNVFRISRLLSEAKFIFITKYDKAVATKHFIDNGDGTLSVTKAEGFVAVDHTENGIKLVDRLEFSKNNFNAGKPGAKSNK